MAVDCIMGFDHTKAAEQGAVRYQPPVIKVTGNDQWGRGRNTAPDMFNKAGGLQATFFLKQAEVYADQVNVVGNNTMQEAALGEIDERCVYIVPA